MALAYIGLGSNLGDRAGYLRRALAALAAEPEIAVEAVSPIVETDPVGFLDQPRFLNAVARLETALGPRELLDRLLDTERTLGRTRGGERFGPRTIDLDLLLYGDLILDESGLQVPHPRLHERRFVLEPLYALEPGLVVPGRGSLREIIAALD